MHILYAICYNYNVCLYAGYLFVKKISQMFNMHQILNGRIYVFANVRRIK